MVFNRKEHYKKNKDKIKEKDKEYYQKNKEKYIKRANEWVKRNKPYRKIYMREYNKRKYKENKNFNIAIRLRSNTGRAFKKYIKERKIWKSSKYGINYKAIIEHLKPFPKDISKYHIDHIKPLTSFNFLNSDGSTNFEEIKKAFVPENHQWLLIKDNQKKGANKQNE